MRSRGEKSGFALPTVLAVLLAVSLVFAVSLNALKGLRDETRQALASVEFERAAMTAEARFGYFLSTEPLGPEGLRMGAFRLAQNQRGAGPLLDQSMEVQQFLYFDGRAYRWVEDAENEAAPPYLLTLQDEAGLVNLYQADPAMLARLFEAAGVEMGAAQDLADELTEYNSEPAPAQPVRTLAELYRLPSARQILGDRAYRTLQSLATVQIDSRAVNINTASPAVLKAWFDLSDSQAAKALDDREDAPLGSPNDIGAVALDNSINYAFPNGRATFTLTDPRTGQVYRSTLVLTPTNTVRPIWTENVSLLRPPQPPAPDRDDIEDFPQVPYFPY